jgi:membrane peptidoglycan carboxypeptidase
MLKNKMGFDRIADTYTKLGFGALTGIELGGESRGIFNKPRPDQLLEQATMAFGQGIALTPLQIITAYAAIANGGFKVRPHLVRRIDDKAVAGPGDEDETQTRIFSEKTSVQMRGILEKVVEGEGTGVLARVEGFRVAGKTGTAQKVDYVHGGYLKNAYWASFAGFIPSDKPKYVIYVMIDHPTKNGVYGGSAAAPVFAKIAQAAVRLVPSHLVAPRVVASHREKPPFVPLSNLKVNPSKDGVAALSFESAEKSNTMPDLTGMPLSYALRVLKHFGFRMELQGVGDRVSEQLPVAGSTAKPDTTTVYLKLR